MDDGMLVRALAYAAAFASATAVVAVAVAWEARAGARQAIAAARAAHERLLVLENARFTDMRRGAAGDANAAPPWQRGEG